MGICLLCIGKVHRKWKTKGERNRCSSVFAVSEVQHWHRCSGKPARALLNALIKRSSWKGKRWIITRHDGLSERLRLAFWRSHLGTKCLFRELKAFDGQRAWLLLSYCALWLCARYTVIQWALSGRVISNCIFIFFAECSFGLVFICFLFTYDITENIRQINPIYTLIWLVSGPGLIIL